MKIAELAAYLLTMHVAAAQTEPKWDNTPSEKWPIECEKVEITSSIDQSKQPAYFYASKANLPRPLNISLHTWSGSFDSKDTSSWMCIEEEYTYIHPDFRGPNDKPEACGSEESKSMPET